MIATLQVDQAEVSASTEVVVSGVILAFYEYVAKTNNIQNRGVKMILKK